MSFELKKYKLAEIADVQTGPFGSQLHKDDYVPHGTPIITVEHLGENFIIHENTPKVSNDDALRLSKYSLCEGDIVFSRVGSVDRRAYVSKKEHGWLFSGRCLRVRVNKKDKIDPKYLSYYFGLESFREYVRSIAVGATMPSLNTKIMSSLEIQAPELNVQVAISKLLSSLDNKIELNNAINKNLEEMAQALFKRWFVDFEFPNENGEPYKSSGGEFEESELGLIPKGWRILRIGDIAEVRGGKRLPKGHELLSNRTEHPYIRITDIDNGRINMRNLMYLKDETFKQISRYIINKNDLFVSIVGTVGIVGSINPNLNNANLTENMAKITIFDVTNKHYLLYYLKSNIGQQLLLSRSVGSTQPKLALIRIKNVPVLLPEKKVLKSFDTIISSYYKLLEKNEIENLYLENLRDTLLPKLMSGEIRVPVEQDHNDPDLPKVGENNAIYQP